MPRCSSKPFQPLHRLKIASALAIAASNSFSLPGLTSICAISVIMLRWPFLLQDDGCIAKARRVEADVRGTAGPRFDPCAMPLYLFRIVLNLGCFMRNFAELTEREVLAVAIASEE